MKCKFSRYESREVGRVTLEDHKLPKCNFFKYLDSIIQKEGNIEEFVNYWIKTEWTKWKRCYWVLVDKNIPLKLNGQLSDQTYYMTLSVGNENIR